MQEVSVCGDATYLIPASEAACSGPADQDPAGMACPKQGDSTTLACRAEVLSYMTGDETGTCVAPEDAQCVQLNTGAWGCVFPGNCNTVNTCTEEPVCDGGEYEHDEHGACLVGDNGYPVPSDNNTALVDTAELSSLQADGSSASAMCLSLGATLLAAMALLI